MLAAAVPMETTAAAPGKSTVSKHAATENKWEESANIFEYGAAANPDMAPIPVLVHPPTLHEEGASRVGLCTFF